MAWERDHLATQERLLFKSDLVKVGHFDCPASDPAFARTPSLDNDVFVFTRSPLWFRRGAGDYRFIAPGDILLHRSGAAVDRRSVSRFGDHTYWFGLHPSIFIETLEQRRLSTVEMGDALIADPLLRHRLVLLVGQLESGKLDSFSTEEIVLGLFDEVCARRSSHVDSFRGGRLSTTERRRRLADSARAYLDAHFKEAVSLQDVAHAANTSLYHLCRVFRQETGLTMHAYVTQQRLGAAAERIAQDETCDLTELALGLGFSSHSHFSRVFSRQVGVPPSILRNRGRQFRPATRIGIGQRQHSGTDL